MSKLYYQLIYNKLINVIKDGRIGDVQVSEIFIDPHVNAILHSLAFIQEQINNNIIESKKYLEKNILKYMYDFLFVPKSSNTIISFNSNYEGFSKVIKKHTKVNIVSKLNYTYLNLVDYKFFKVKSIKSYYLYFENLLNTSLYGENFLVIDLLFDLEIKNNLDYQILNLFVNSNNYTNILTSIFNNNKKVYISQNGKLYYVGDIDIFCLDKFDHKYLDVLLYFQYLYQYAINDKNFSVLRIKLNKVSKYLLNEKNIRLVISTNNIYDEKDFLLINFLSVYNVYSYDTSSFKLEKGFKKSISISNNIHQNQLITNINELFCITEDRKKKYKVYSYNSIYSNDSSQYFEDLKWRFEYQYVNDRYCTNVYFIPENLDVMQRIKDCIFYTTAICINNINYSYNFNKINIGSLSGISDIRILSQPTTVIHIDIEKDFEYLNLIKNININNSEIFYRFIVLIFDEFLLFFNQPKCCFKYITNVVIDNSNGVCFSNGNILHNVIKVNFKFFVSDSYVAEIKIGFYLSIIYFLKYYLDVKNILVIEFITTKSNNTIFKYDESEHRS